MPNKRRAASLVQPPVALVAPAGWSAEEKRLVQQIQAVVLDVYRRWGRLGLSDFSVALRQAFDRTVTVDDFESVFLQTAQSLSVQFGTPREVKGPTLELSRDRFAVRVRNLFFNVINEANQTVALLYSTGTGLHTGTLHADNVHCPKIFHTDKEYVGLHTDSKKVVGAINELRAAIGILESRIELLENPEEVEA